MNSLQVSLSSHFYHSSVFTQTSATTYQKLFVLNTSSPKHLCRYMLDYRVSLKTKLI